jgi:hypothetical protein
MMNCELGKQYAAPAEALFCTLKVNNESCLDKVECDQKKSEGGSGYESANE